MGLEETVVTTQREIQSPLQGRGMKRFLARTYDIAAIAIGAYVGSDYWQETGAAIGAIAGAAIGPISRYLLKASWNVSGPE